MIIERRELPVDALLCRYARGGGYTDCYSTRIPALVSHARYVEAFYTTAIFKLERLLLAWLVSRPSSDDQARRLAAGELGSFAAWTVEDRCTDQLLMCDFKRRTRSWLMVAAINDAPGPATRLYFGSAVVPLHDTASGDAKSSLVFRALLGFHKIYSRLLLRAAASRLARAR